MQTRWSRRWRWTPFKLKKWLCPPLTFYHVTSFIYIYLCRRRRFFAWRGRKKSNSQIERVEMNWNEGEKSLCSFFSSSRRREFHCSELYALQLQYNFNISIDQEKKWIPSMKWFLRSRIHVFLFIYVTASRLGSWSLASRVWFWDLGDWKTYWSHWKKPQNVNSERTAPLRFSLCWRGFHIYTHTYIYPSSVVSVSQHLPKKMLLTSKPVGCFFSFATQICLFKDSPSFSSP